MVILRAEKTHTKYLKAMILFDRLHKIQKTNKKTQNYKIL